MQPPRLVFLSKFPILKNPKQQSNLAFHRQPLTPLLSHNLGAYILTMSGNFHVYRKTYSYQRTSHVSFVFILNIFSLFALIIISLAGAETQNLDSHLAVEVGTNVIFNCTSNKQAIWSKIISDGESATVEFIFIGKRIYDKDLADKFR